MGSGPADLPSVLAATRAREHRTFPGRLDRRDLRRSERAALLVFRGVEGDFRDWEAVRAWASSIADRLLAGTPA
ncbi:MAG TPA: hypothetical protein VKV23_01135 [Acidimicrobiales bacterium]|jgi:menaquinone-dependent protoporphyrinogen oxidase|nr:hypothetical protein [Acidimicrobiales bacterium]